MSHIALTAALPRMPETVVVEVNGRKLQVPRQMTAAVAILTAGVEHFRTSVQGEPRGPLCGMGICFECKATVDGRPGQRTCQMLVRPGMVIRTT